MQKSIFIGLLVICPLFLVSCNQQKSEWKGTVEERDGVTIVKNPKEPMYEEQVFSLIEDMTIGDNEVRSDYAFEVITTIRADDNGNIYVLDGKAEQVKVFDKNGKYLRDIGRQGQGPGEYSLPSGMHIMSENELMVSSITRRLSFFSLNGKFLRQISDSPDPFPFPDSKGHFIVKTATMAAGENRITELKKLNSDLELLFTIGKLEVESTIGLKKLNPFSTLLFFTVLPDDCVVWGTNNEYRLTIVNTMGKTIKEIVKEFAPVRVTEEYKREYLERTDPLIRSRGISYEFPESFPVFRAISSDDEGRIYVWTFEKDDENKGYYDVFDPEGIYVARIALESNPVYWKKGKLYSVHEDEEGFQLVKRYKVSWNY